ncbi:MAG: crotonyl-CoA carboxylase/reductase [Proteobacteria bacterium]|nr:crotonyl-CoA carboxylase/reductase [Pseudomonadota bacterium]
MWAYGINKEHSNNLQKIPLNNRKPSDGIIKMEVPEPNLNDDEVLVKVKSSALNYNSIWSSLSHPISPFQLINGHIYRNKQDISHLQDYAIFGSDASGVVVRVGKNVRKWKENDEVIIHCNIIDTEESIAQMDGMLPKSQSIWGYETNYGAFAEFTKVKSSQLIHKPKNISWEVAGSFCLTLSTAYRMLISPNGASLRAGQNCLIWGASGGLGNFAIQLANLVGANPIAVVSNDEKEELCRKLGAKIVVNRGKDKFGNFILENGEPNYLSWRDAKKTLEKKGVNDLDVVFEHIGKETLGVSLFLLSRGGKVVTCAASSGFNATIDLRYLWMSLKTIIGSHFANYYESEQASQLVFDGRIKPLIHSVNSINNLPKMMDEMHRNQSYGKIVFMHE